MGDQRTRGGRVLVTINARTGRAKGKRSGRQPTRRSCWSSREAPAWPEATEGRELQSSFLFESRIEASGPRAYGELSITNEKDLFDALRGTTLGLSIRCAERIAALLSGILSVHLEDGEVLLRLEIAL